MAFTYSRLRSAASSLRLLTICPGKLVDPISCRINHYEPNSRPTYNALSYTWGTGDETETIQMNGIAFPVRENLFKALQKLRSEQQPKIFWIDAICINQKDDEERSRQVLRMRDIFKDADQVIVWLGESEGCQDLAMNWLEFVQSTTDTALIGNSTIPYDHAQWYRQMVFENPNRMKAAVWLGLRLLVSRDYWDRMWIVQELAVASDIQVHCGTKSIAWTTIIEALRMIAYTVGRKKNHQQVNPALRNVIRFNMLANFQVLREQASDVKPPYWLFAILDQFRHSTCTDPRDQIWSLLGLLQSSSAQQRIPIDYKRRSIIDVYTDVVELCVTQPRTALSWRKKLREDQPVVERFSKAMSFQFEPYKPKARLHGPLNILCSNQPRLHFPLHGIRNFPSWLPDWSMAYGYCMSIDAITGSRFTASGTEYAEPAFSSDRRTLTVKGVRWDTIDFLHGISEQTRRAISAPTDEQAIVGRVKEWFAMAQDIKGIPFKEEEFWRTLVLDSWVEGVRDEAPKSWYKMTIEDLTNSINKPGSEKADEYLTNLVFSRLRQFAVSRKGAYLMVPIDTEPADSLCILHGCDVPVVLRPKGGKWEWIGECYGFGLMDGEICLTESWKDMVESMDII